jgi:two-component system chemotaxis sensor kinase CheA
VVEEISDPLIHIIRNAVDHGFETTAERKAVGKPEHGKLILEAYQESNHIVIEITDDGRGIDPERIKAKALEKGLLTEDDLQRMSNRELLRLTLMGGFSTAEQITKTSGRGVGMDVVKRNIEKLNGTVEVESEPGQQTQVRLKIPLTLAIISALQVRVGTDQITIPLSNVDETLRIYDKDTSTIEGAEVVHLRGRTLPIFRLSNLFSIQGDEHEGGKSFVVIVNTEREQIGLVVDELMGQEEVVIKPLVDYLQEKSGFSGATIVGDGRISLILDISSLVKMTTAKQAKHHQEQAKRRKISVSA